MGYEWIALLTDYGREDGFVAACHGVIARIAPAVRVIDITHEVPAQDVRRGAAVLAQTVPYLPAAVVVGVVDPGVGTPRRGVAVAAGESVLVGPDNGVLSWAADALGGVTEAVELVASEYWGPTRSPTFDGRDVFAPVAAHLARGTALAALGPSADDLVRLPAPTVIVHDRAVATEVLTVDHFGNIQLAARPSDLDAARLAGTELTVGFGELVVGIALGVTFADAEPGALVLYEDAAGYLAVALNLGHAADVLGLHAGTPVTLLPANPRSRLQTADDHGEGQG